MENTLLDIPTHSKTALALPFWSAMDFTTCADFTSRLAITHNAVANQPLDMAWLQHIFTMITQSNPVKGDPIWGDLLHYGSYQTVGTKQEDSDQLRQKGVELTTLLAPSRLEVPDTTMEIFAASSEVPLLEVAMVSITVHPPHKQLLPKGGKEPRSHLSIRDTQ